MSGIKPLKIAQDLDHCVLRQLVIDLAEFVDPVPAQSLEFLPLIHDSMVETHHEEEPLVVLGKSGACLLDLVRCRADDLAQILLQALHWLADDLVALLQHADWQRCCGFG